MKIKLFDIITDAGTQMREAVNEDTVLDYMQAEDLPPITLFRDDQGLLYLADGFHRFLAAMRANRGEISAHVIEGSLRDAILFAVGANAEHGLRRKPEDKRRAVLTMLNDEVWRQWSDREIARHCCVDNKFVGKLRKILTEDVLSENSDNRQDFSDSSTRTYTTKHGTVAEMKVGNIGKQKQTVSKTPSEADTSGKISGGITFHVSEFEAAHVASDPAAGESFSAVSLVEVPPPVKESQCRVELRQNANLSPEQASLGKSRMLRDQLRILRRRVTDTHKEVQGFAESELGQHLLEYEQSLKTAFETVNRYLKTTEPYCLCFRCGGVGCPVCKQRGWMDKTQHDSRNPPDNITLV